MKLRVVGWTDYDTTFIKEGEGDGASVAAVVDDIKAHGYLFSGWNHQNSSCGAPVLNDGKIRRFSMREFGSVMAEAHGQTGVMDYCAYAFDLALKECVMPKNEYDIYHFEPEENINEAFTLAVTEEQYAAALSENKITLDDLPELRYIAAGDILVLKCGDRSKEYTVKGEVRRKDLTDEELLALRGDMFYSDDKAVSSRAEEILNAAKTVMDVALEVRMTKPQCKTYFAFWLGFDKEKNAALLRERRDCTPEEIGIYNKDEVEKAITEAFGVTPEWRRHHFIIGKNESYDADVNAMLRVTLKNLFGKEDKIKEIQKKFSICTTLNVVPYILSDSEEPHQYLSLERDIIEFLYKSETDEDLDYYVF